MSFRSRWFVVAIAALPTFALAQDRTEKLESLLRHLPTAVVLSGSAVELVFNDFAAARRAVRRSSDVPANPFAPYLRLMNAVLAQSIGVGLDGGWKTRVGFGPEDIDSVVMLDQPPRHLAIYELGGGADLADVGRALEATGYARRAVGTWTAWWRGREDFAIDLRAADAADPFGGDLGRSARVATDGRVLVHASAWPDIEALAAEGPDRFSSRREVAALLGALNDERFAGAELVQAYFLLWPWSAADAASALPPGERPAATPGVGLPPWQMGLFADLSTGDTDYAAAALVYGSRSLAERLSAPLLDNWRSVGPPSRPGVSFADLAGGSARAFVIGDDPAVLVLSIERPPADTANDPRNRPFNLLVDAYFRRELAILGAR